MSEKYYSLTQLKSITRTEGNQWTGPYDIIHPDDLKKLKPADVRPVKEGYWQEGEFKYLTCSECGCDTNLYDQHGFPIGQRKGHPYPCFCPHCGADMMGGADG